MKKYKKISAVLAGVLLLSSMRLTSVSAENQPLAGDMNLDDKIGVSDIIMMHKYLKGKQPITEAQFHAGDVNQDDKLNIFDFMQTKQSIIQDFCKEIPVCDIRYFSDYNIDYYYGEKEFPAFPKTKLLQSPEDMQLFFPKETLKKFNMQYDYDEAYFTEHNLLAVIEWEGALDYSYEVTDIQQDAGKNWNIHILRTGQYCMAEMEEIKIVLIPTEKEITVREFRVNFDNQMPIDPYLPEETETETYQPEETETETYPPEEPKDTPKTINEPQYRTIYIDDRMTDKCCPVVITSLEELKAYSEENQITGNTTGAMSPEAPLYDLCVSDGYNAEFFENHNLVFVVITAESGSFRYAIQDFQLDNSGGNIEIIKTMPVCCTCDMAEWHLPLTVDKTVTADTPFSVHMTEVYDRSL